MKTTHIVKASEIEKILIEYFSNLHFPVEKVRVYSEAFGSVGAEIELKEANLEDYKK